ncbi:MAG: hypothetical protein NC131_20225 [Roseburia sp.]|nr:hypothetical protein [Roseburia sp.]
MRGTHSHDPLSRAVNHLAAESGGSLTVGTEHKKAAHIGAVGVLPWRRGGDEDVAGAGAPCNGKAHGVAGSIESVGKLCIAAAPVARAGSGGSAN